MKITVKAVALATAALTLTVSAMFATPASAKTMNHSKRTMRHYRMSRTSRMSRMHRMSWDAPQLDVNHAPPFDGPRDGQRPHERRHDGDNGNRHG